LLTSNLIFITTRFGIAVMTSSAKGITSDNRNGWAWGFTPQAEIWNGRVAMLGFAAILITACFYR
jgi:Chlorophyll A-B binding protein